MDNLAVFYYLNESEIWPNLIGGLGWELACNSGNTLAYFTRYKSLSGIIRGGLLKHIS
jgi:hypothetical protein